MAVTDEGAAFRKTNFGVRVDRATATLPQTATGTLFLVATGNVLITNIVGVVTTSIQAQTNNLKLVATPTVGAVNDLSGLVDVNALAVGGLLAPQGLAADLLVKSTGGGISTLRQPLIVAPGAIGLSASASSTGAIKWTLTYCPLDNGATVVAG